MTRGDKLRQASDIELAANIIGCVGSYLEQSGIIQKHQLKQFMEQNIDSIIEWLQKEESEVQHE